MAPPTPHRLEIIRDQVGLRVTFEHSVDRMRHTVELLVAGRSVPLMASVEGTDLDRWPPSPPLQQVSLERIPNADQAVLAIGMAGPSHWSLSVVTDPCHLRLTWEVACRYEGRPALLGSEYLTFADATVDRSTATWTIGPARARLMVELDAMAPDHSRLVSAGPNVLRAEPARNPPIAAGEASVDFRSAKFVPTQPAPIPPVATTARWKYVIDAVTRSE